MIAESPIVEEVRQRAQELSARFGHNLGRYIEHLQKTQAQHQELLVSQIRIVRPESASAPSGNGEVQAQASATS
jgi:hypothetical protein